jgi:hypothetical protein
MEEHRHFDRTHSDAIVEMRHPTFGVLEVRARNLSAGGIFVLLGAAQPVPPVGTVLQVRIKRHTGPLNAEPVPMRVVHHQPGGLGLAFERTP